MITWIKDFLKKPGSKHPLFVGAFTTLLLVSLTAVGFIFKELFFSGSLRDIPTGERNQNVNLSDGAVVQGDIVNGDKNVNTIGKFIEVGRSYEWVEINKQRYYEVTIDYRVEEGSIAPDKICLSYDFDVPLIKMRIPRGTANSDSWDGLKCYSNPLAIWPLVFRFATEPSRFDVTIQ